jgi:hypothetical protein
MMRLPALAASRTSTSRNTVPAPIVATSPNESTSRAMLSNGCGELSGTSIVVMPASITPRTMASHSSGLMPRKMPMMLRVTSSLS